MSSKPRLRHPQQLPLITEDRRAYVTAFAQSALFCVAHKSRPRERFENKIIATMPNVRIKYSGQELRDDDQDVLIALMHRARGMTWGEEGLVLEFTGNEMLTDLEWPSQSSEYYTKLRACLDRMQSGSVIVERVNGAGKAKRARAQLLRKFNEEVVPNTGSNKWVVWIEPETLAMFASEGSRLELMWDERKVLSKPISKWLHSFISSQPHPTNEWFVVPEYLLFDLCGSKAKDSRTLRELVKTGLEEMQDKGVIAEWRIYKKFVYVAFEEGLGEIDRATAAAQQRFMDVIPFDGGTEIEEVAA